MPNIEPEKYYTIRITLPKPSEEIVKGSAGSLVEQIVEEARLKYPDFKRIAVFDSLTGEAVMLIKK